MFGTTFHTDMQFPFDTLDDHPMRKSMALCKEAQTYVMFSGATSDLKLKSKFRKNAIERANEALATALAQNSASNEQKAFLSFKVALIHLNIGDDEGALNCLNYAIYNKNPDQLKAIMLGVDICIELGLKINQLFNIADRVAETSEEKARVSLKTAEVLCEDDEHEDAKDKLMDTIKYQTSYRFDALFLLSSIHTVLEQHGEALYYYQLAKELYPNKAPEGGWCDGVIENLCTQASSTFEGCACGIKLIDSFLKDNATQTNPYLNLQKIKAELIKRIQMLKQPQNQNADPYHEAITDEDETTIRDDLEYNPYLNDNDNNDDDIFNNEDYVTKIRNIAKKEISDDKEFGRFRNKLNLSAKRGSEKFFKKSTYGLNPNTQEKIEKIWGSQGARHREIREKNEIIRKKIKAFVPKYNPTTQETKLMKEVEKNIPARNGLTGEELKDLGRKIHTAITVGVTNIGDGGFFENISKNKKKIENAIKLKWHTKEFEDILDNFRAAQPRNYTLDDNGNIQRKKPKNQKYLRPTQISMSDLISPHNTNQSFNPFIGNKYSYNGFFHRRNTQQHQQYQQKGRSTTPNEMFQHTGFTPPSPFPTDDNPFNPQQQPNQKPKEQAPQPIIVEEEENPYSDYVLGDLQLPFFNNPSPTITPSLFNVDLDTPTEEPFQNQGTFDEDQEINLGYPGLKNYPIGNSSP